MGNGLRSVAGPAGDLAVAVAGRGGAKRSGEAVLFVHPANLGRRCWSAVTALLADRICCVALDLSGHGDSGRSPDRAYGVASWADECAAVLSALRLERVHLVGASVGAAVVVELAASEPTAIATVTTVGGAFLPAPGAGTELEAEIEALGPIAALRQHLVAAALAPGAAPALSEAIVPDLSENDAATVIAIWRAALATDVRPALERLHAPTLAIVGEADRTCPPDESRWFAAEAGGRLVVLPEVGHLPMYEAPDRVAEMIGRHTSAARSRGT